MKRLGIAVALLATVLAGCNAAHETSTAKSTIPILNDKTHKRVASFPLSLGLMEPSVTHYRCVGDYAPAMRKLPSPAPQQAYVGLPFWQLTLRCVNPKLKFNLPKGFMRAGMVWVYEMPTTKRSLMQAIQFLHPVSDLSLSAIGKLPIGEGRQGKQNLVWVLGDKTTYIGFRDKKQSGTVLVYFSGRAVPLSVLRQFAKSMHPLPSGSQQSNY